MVWQARKYASLNLTKVNKMKKGSKSYTRKFNGFWAKLESSSNTLKRAWSNSLSKMEADKRYWLIVFTRPEIPREKQDDADMRKNWCTKFWVWDSIENQVVFEDVLLKRSSVGEFSGKHLNPVWNFPVVANLEEELGHVIFWSADIDLYLADFKKRKVLHTPGHISSGQGLKRGQKFQYVFLDQKTLLTQMPTEPIFVYDLSEDVSSEGLSTQGISSSIARLTKLSDLRAGDGHYKLSESVLRLKDEILAIFSEKNILVIKKYHENVTDEYRILVDWNLGLWHSQIEKVSFDEKTNTVCVVYKDYVPKESLSEVKFELPVG